MSSSRPNIILLMTDQQRGDCLGIDGHPDLLTPNLDALATSGSWFRRAYSTCPSCIPARRALLTGRHPANNGLCGFRDGVPISSPTLPRILRDAGYQTALVGRGMHQFPSSARYGYETIDPASNYELDCFHWHLRQATGQVDGMGALGLDFNGWNARPWHTDEALHPVCHVVNQALKFLENRDETCPFFLTVSLYAPHPPLCPPTFYFDRYLQQDLVPPVVGSWVDYPDEPQAGLPVNSPRVRLRGEALRACLAGYYGMINYIDDQLSRLFSRVGPGGAVRYDLANTVFVFASDHGEMLGDHCFFRKCEPYEGSARIPFFFAGGSDTGLRAGQSTGRPVCLEDLLPTLADLAGAEIPDGVDGQSLVPFLREGQEPPRGFLHGEHAPCYSAQQAHHFLVGEKTKYIWRPYDGTEQLFDLANDQREARDLAAIPEHASSVERWRARLVAKLAGRPEGFSDGIRLIPGRFYSDCPSPVERL